MPKTLTSSASTHDLLLRAISGKKVINFHYKNKQRVAEPHDYGIQNGIRRLLCYQIGGQTNTGRLPSWRLVDVTDMKDVQISNHTFAGNRPPESGKHRSWEVVFARVGDSDR
jgi:hypothetical protein